jgi:hypothetical protein
MVKLTAEQMINARLATADTTERTVTMPRAGTPQRYYTTGKPKHNTSSATNSTRKRTYSGQTKK